MDRRQFLLGAAAAAAAQLGQAAPPAGGGPQEVFDLNRNWQFSPTRADTAARMQTVTLPHANVTLPWHSFSDQAFQFVSTYRRSFRAPAEWSGRRVFVEFGGVMTAATVDINGHKFAEYKGGYTPFRFELTPFLKLGADNALTVEVDSRERADIPPFGHDVDYLTFGGIYRDVQVRVTPPTYIENVYAKPVRVLALDRELHVRCYLDGPAQAGSKLTVAMRRVNWFSEAAFGPATTFQFEEAAESYDVVLHNLGEIVLWDLNNPTLYDVRVQLTAADGTQDQRQVRIGFREARFTEAGFLLNGQPVKLRGLNRHQTYPYVGGAMPSRVQDRDAYILRKELHCNIVRTSHYPQSPAFLSACDGLGLMVLEEIPGWQHIGDRAWQDISVRNVEEMIRRDWNHPSIVLWGVRINESPDNHEFYTRTNEVAHRLDDARPTGGIRNNYNSELLEDVFTINDFGLPLRKPNHPAYLNTEYAGHMLSTKRNDNIERVIEHVQRHATVQDQVNSDDRYAGGIGWCAFDYNTHKDFGSGDHICYHGVSDIFRIPKPAAYVYASQCDPEEEIVLEPGFFWSNGDRSGAGGPNPAPILSNCDHLKIYYAGKLRQELAPDRVKYPHLKHPPFTMDWGRIGFHAWSDLTIEGYLRGELVKTVKLSGSGEDADFRVLPDDRELRGDGRDATRVVLKVVDEYGNIRPFATGAIALQVSGPVVLIGENPFSLVGGTGAVWLRTKQAAGAVTLVATHPYLGMKTVNLTVIAAPAERL